ncbi:MAG: hypothetical protein QM685_04145 [Paraburkholderia sp.]
MAPSTSPLPGWLEALGKLPGFRGETASKGDGVIADPATELDPTIKAGTPIATPSGSGVIDDIFKTPPVVDVAKGLVDYVITSINGNQATDSTGAPPPKLSPDGAGRSGAFNEAKRASGVPVSHSRLLFSLIQTNEGIHNRPIFTYMKFRLKAVALKSSKSGMMLLVTSSGKETRKTETLTLMILREITMTIEIKVLSTQDVFQKNDVVLLERNAFYDNARFGAICWEISRTSKGSVRRGAEFRHRTHRRSTTRVRILVVYWKLCMATRHESCVLQKTVQCSRCSRSGFVDTGRSVRICY